MAISFVAVVAFLSFRNDQKIAHPGRFLLVVVMLCCAQSPEYSFVN